MKKYRLILIMALSSILLLSCELDEEEGSHNSGKNCLSCHSSFRLAGTIYNETFSSVFSGSEIRVTTQPNGQGTHVLTLSTDKKGNFYTSSSINFGTGLYVSVEGNSGTIKYMGSSITSGACNSCHGITIDKIWVK